MLSKTRKDNDDSQDD